MIWSALLRASVMMLPACEMYVSTLRMYIYQHQLCLFVVHFQLSVILGQRHNELTALKMYYISEPELTKTKAGLKSCNAQ